MLTKIIPIKTDHALAESTVFLSFFKKAEEYEHYFNCMDFCSVIDPACTLKQNRKRSGIENVLLKDGKIIWKIVFIKKCIGFECHDYTRWNDFISIVKKIFLLFDTTVFDSITSVGLFVKDEFDVIAEKDFSLSELFNKKSKFIAPIFFDTKYPPAMSAYKFYEHNIKHKNCSYCLANDIKVIALSAENSLKFAVAHKQSAFFRDKNTKIEQSKILELFEMLMQLMHEQNKEYVSNILEKNVLKSIGMV